MQIKTAYSSVASRIYREMTKKNVRIAGLRIQTGDKTNTKQEG
jgi:hypothetical protein